MKIALITENSQAAKNGLIYDALNTAAEPFGRRSVRVYGAAGPAPARSSRSISAAPLRERNRSSLPHAAPAEDHYTI